ncbi:ABC-F family ATP-binding cassette domain-containing protein [Malaciobacter mytili]|uniref:ABC transporter ATP-binding protein n=1 Tax=Malaciobacter mytili LMG 24559 TaxID=1032238 RepID=A0AAX2AFW6_9BACT|nr:ABC-F family ATP-binding cassette domain-containing protein [Malaciobacter mytili]AXH13996.1 ABC transporter, ATP-binding protein [Malaciobacter mytili LMG 24559]RXI37863.1 ABC transporter ATP-binding protein [Malaciobacter mytili]RXK15282.1 ABC transporter ATP-binding protein [Malaciobacter mytili LMG 24559]
MIELINISKSYPTSELYSELNLRLNSGDKVGLVGRNGTGKSTLFKLILGEEHADSGDINFPKGYKIGALKQYFNFSEKTLLDETALALSEDDKYNIYKAEKILFGLGFTQEDLDKDPKSFSGGYQIRINLAKLLLTEPNMLLLDEPTNYLDILSIRWLKAFLKSFQGEVILITHDRDFMDSVCTHTLGIIRKSAFMIQGGTRKFYEQLASNEEHYEKQKIAQEKKIKELEEFIAKNKARAATATLAQSKVKILEKMDIMDDLEYDSNLNFDFNYKDTAAKFLLEVKDLSFGYTPENILFKDITFALSKGETLGIIGKNGKGKSTLLNVIAGELKQLSGSVDYHPSCVFGHFGQTNISHLNQNNTIMDEIYSVNNKLSEPVIRSICGLMMFSKDNAKKKISLLSGGEKSRVMLGKIIAQDVNLLFLDEPTNHLDIDSIEALTNAIKAFEGSCIIVTHSEELLRAVCDRLIVFTNDGADYFNGTYDEFLEKIGWDDDSVTEKKPVAKPKVNKKESKRLRAAIVAQKSKETAPLKKEIAELEALIPTLNPTEKFQKESQLLDLQLKLEEMNAEFEKRMKEV